MVDEIISNNERIQRQFFINASSCMDIDMNSIDASGKTDALNRSTYDTSTSSPESTSDNGFSFSGVKSNAVEEKSSEKKVHWNVSQVLSLLDCIEKRIGDFRKKSVQKSVWQTIGREMLEHGDFSVDHCYNKWKNLRRDVRLFNNSSNLPKMSIRNAFVMERVQKMVTEIGYENLSRKSSSPVDIVDQTESWLPYVKINQVDDEPIAVDFAELNNSNPVDENFLSLLSDPSMLQTILMNQKMLEEMLPGLDVSALLAKYVPANQETIPLPINNIQPITVVYDKKPQTCDINDHQQYIGYTQYASVPVDSGNSWPHQLYELLHSFRDEENRQIQRLGQIVNCVQVMQESTKRRLSTINQLISLAGMLITQR